MNSQYPDEFTADEVDPNGLLGEELATVASRIPNLWDAEVVTRACLVLGTQADRIAELETAIREALGIMPCDFGELVDTLTEALDG